MSKIIVSKISLIAICIVFALFTSCKKDDDNNSSSGGGGTGGGGTGGGGGGTEAGVLSGKFSVSETKQVRFSQGNLQYQASTGIWRFAINQYDCIGEANSNISSTYNGWIDLFGWGTSGYNNRYPYMTSTNSSDYYNGDYDISGTNYDWGVYNAISNGGNKSGMWRTLTRDEWRYLLHTRTDASSKYSLATVNGVTGLVFLPDNWTLPSGLGFISHEDGGVTDYTKNIYSSSQWSAMEQSGAVFLPSAGGRRGTTVIMDYDTGGIYWSSSYDEHYEGAYYAYNLFCGTEQPGNIVVGSGGSGRLWAGMSVRLVQDIN